MFEIECIILDGYILDLNDCYFSSGFAFEIAERRKEALRTGVRGSFLFEIKTSNGEINKPGKYLLLRHFFGKDFYLNWLG